MKLSRTRAMAGIVGLSLVAVLVGANLAAADTPGPQSATEPEIEEFTAVYRAYQRIVFDAMVTGDLSAFPKIFYNDPTVELRPGMVDLEAKYHDKVLTTLAATDAKGPIGAEMGFLSAQLAYFTNLNEGAEAWQLEASRASAESREPSISNLPSGITPYQRPDASEWGYVPVQLVNVQVGGNHATADVVFVEPDQLDEYLKQPDAYRRHMVLTLVEGQWYISNLWGEGNP